MSMEFTDKEVGTWPRGKQMAELYERTCGVARRLPRYSLRSITVANQVERPAVEFGLQFFMRRTLVNRIQNDVGALAAGSLAGVAVTIENSTVGNPAAGSYGGDLPLMHDKTWEMLQEHQEQVQALDLPFRSLRTVLYDPMFTRVITKYDSPYPSLLTTAEAAVTTTEDKITLYERIHEADFEHRGGLSAYSFTVPQLHFRMGEANPSRLELKVYDCTPDGWTSHYTELAEYDREYPNGVRS